MLLHAGPQAVNTVTDAVWIQLERQLNTSLLKRGFFGDELPQNCQTGQVVAPQHKLSSFVLTAGFSPWLTCLKEHVTDPLLMAICCHSVLAQIRTHV